MKLSTCDAVTFLYCLTLSHCVWDSPSVGWSKKWFYDIVISLSGLLTFFGVFLWARHRLRSSPSPIVRFCGGVKKLASFFGAGDLNITTHSFRRSGASELSRQGIPLADILLFGRWLRGALCVWLHPSWGGSSSASEGFVATRASTATPPLGCTLRPYLVSV